MVDEFKCGYPCFEIVDLDSLETFCKKWLEMSVSELHKELWSMFGRSLYYMQYFYPDIHSSEHKEKDSQYSRVDKMCKEYAKRRKNLLVHNEVNRLELLKMLYKFEDEVENQC